MDDDPESRNIYLIPEMCAMTGLTDDMRNDQRLMKELSNHTRISPEKRVDLARGHLAAVKG